VKNEKPRVKPQQQPQPPNAGGGKTARVRVSAGVSPHHDLAAATELSRNALSRERYQLIFRVIIGLIALIAILLASIIWLATRTVEPKYFSVDMQGRIRELTALNRPMPSNDQVINWVATAVTKAHTLSFASYQQQLDEMKFNFTPEGWRGFEDALRRAGFLDSLIKSKYITSASPTGAPIIAAEGLVGEVYAWRLQVPLVVSFQSASSRESRSLMIEVTVVRRPETENPVGLGIAQFVAR